jgi:uncharacterized membrane protein YoaK (UPF0700 family)
VVSYPTVVNRPKTIAYCSLIALVASYVVGAVSNGSLRHEVQTLPLWFPIVLGFVNVILLGGQHSLVS